MALQFHRTILKMKTKEKAFAAVSRTIFFSTIGPKVIVLVNYGLQKEILAKFELRPILVSVVSNVYGPKLSLLPPLKC